MKRVFGAAAALAAIATPAAAGDLISDGQLRGFIDIRAGAADGEESFTDRGFGKTRFGGDNGDWAGGGAVEAALVWRPHFTWTLDGYLHLQSEAHQDSFADVVEAYLTYKPMPVAGVRYSGRLGLMYPPVSLEHEGAGWRTVHTLTPSAINTWIGEEVLVVGAEGSARGEIAGMDVGATLGVFGYNDTSGTLLSYRGWGMHDILATAFGDTPLPNRSPAWHTLRARQARNTDPVIELDDRAGYYARLEWRPIGPISLDITHYDNAGDRISLEDGQWSWETRFTNVGMRWKLSDDTRILTQAMSGQTIWGRRMASGYWVDVDFNSAYALVSHDIGENTLAGRIDWFETIDRSNRGLDNNDEEGWAATLDYSFPLTAWARLYLEGLHIESDRPSRADVGLAPEQEQTTLQSAVRMAF